MLKNILVFLALSLMLVACDPSDLRYGLAESCFQLAAESRVPKWIKIPEGYSRNDIDIEFCSYLPPFMKPRVIFTIKSRSSGKILSKMTGIDRYHPDGERCTTGNYPCYVITAVNGVEEVFEKRQSGDIFYISDDPKLTEGLKK